MIIHVHGTPAPADILTAWEEVFPRDGAYLVKATVRGRTPLEEGTGFDEWFLQEIAERSLGQFSTLQEAIWGVLEGMLAARGVEAPSQLAWWELQQTLFDVTAASTAHMTGLHIPEDIINRLTALGWTRPGVLDFPALAFRVGKIYERLNRTAKTSWPELLDRARSVPLTDVERAAVGQVRQRAGVWMKPIFDDAGQVWTAERELTPLKRTMVRGVRERAPWRRLAQQLSNSQRAVGIRRDAERVIRTEMMFATHSANWELSKDREKWGDDTLVFRMTSSRACRGCLRLYKLPDGTPHLYRMVDVERWSKEPNRGNWRTWHPMIGSTHPACMCSPWAKWYAELSETFERSAPRFRAILEELGVFAEAA